MKKIVSLLLAAIMMCSTFVTALAMNATPTASPLTVEAGKDVTVNVTVDEAYTGLIGLEARLYYNTDLFTVKSSSSANKDVVVRADTLTDSNGSYLQISLVSNNMTGAVSEGETIATVVFTAKEDISETTKAKFRSKIFVGETDSVKIGESAIKDIEVTITPKPCDHKGTETETTYAVKETGKHTVTVTCKKCGNAISSAEEACTPDEENPTYTTKNNGKHDKIIKCTKCSGTVTSVEEDCVEGTDRKCEKCGYLFPEKQYTVTVSVVPTTANVTFYVGEDAAQALDSSKVADNGIKSSYHVYTLTVPAGTYSYRGVDTSDSNRNLGGAGFEVTQDDSITLVRTNYYFDSSAGVITSVDDFELELTHPYGLKPMVIGEKYLDSAKSNRVTAASFLIAKGSQQTTYKKTVTFSDEIAKQYGKTQVSSNNIRATTTSVQNFRIDTPLKSYEVVAPQGATVEFFKQANNYNVKKVADSDITVVDNGNGTISYLLASTRGDAGSITYRATMPGKVVKAGYLANYSNTITKTTTITFADNEDPKSTENKTGNTNLAGRMESSTMVNVNGQNELTLGVGSSFRLRAYRAAWQIINTDTANYMIEPDFNYTIISGAEHITLTPVTECCTGNAGTGNNSNWMDIKGVSSGIAVIEVSYDAIDIVGGTSYTGTYGATDPKRTSLIIINVGGEKNELVLKASGKDYIWDTEYDTVYTLENTATFNFTATLNEAAPTVQLSTDKGKTWKDVTKNSDGSFTAEGLVEGNNILKFTADGKTAYQVVRAAKVTYTVTDSTPDDGTVQVGDSLTISFKGIYQPIPKFSGIYNPGYRYQGVGGNTISYDLPDGVTLEGTGGGQYNFISSNYYTVTSNKAGTYTISGGCMAFNVMGINDPLGGHRTLTDNGVGVNMEAVSTNHIRSVLPDITLTWSEHSGEVVYTWSADNSTCTASRECTIHNTTETETVNTACKTTDATCTESGKKVYTATFTTDDFVTQTKTVELPALGHSTTHHEAVKANCVVGGNIEYWECGTCHKKFSDAACKNEVTTVTTEKDKNNHKGEFELKNAKEATCTESGYTGDTYCKACGEISKSGTEIPMLAHSTTHHEAVKANCVAGGSIEYWECGTCHKKFSDAACKNEVTTVTTEKDKNNHKGGFELKNAKEATCTESGYTGDTYCKACGELVEAGKVSPVVPHKFGQWTVIKEPTTADGLKAHSCTVCGYEEKYAVPRLSDNSKPIHITLGGNKNETEKNPETGAQVSSGFATVAVLTAAAVLVGKKRK